MYDTFLARRSVPLEYLHRSIYWLHGTFIKPFGIKVEKEKRLLDAGNWYGNDSAWRMAVDLMKAFAFADKYGEMSHAVQRKMFSVVDGIIGGENKGPLEPDPKPAGILIGGENFLAVDIVSTRLMGFDPMKVRVFKHLMEETEFDLGVHDYQDVVVKCSNDEWRNCLANKSDSFLSFKPYPGWVGQLEISSS
jgi:hypothetical protein